MFYVLCSTFTVLYSLWVSEWWEHENRVRAIKQQQKGEGCEAVKSIARQIKLITVGVCVRVYLCQSVHMLEKWLEWAH